MFRDFTASGPEADAKIEAWGKQIDQLNLDYDNYVESVVGRRNYKTLKSELEIFNKRIEAKSPQKVLFVSPW